MKTVLLLAYDFPPHTSVGAQRPYSFYRYFRKYGYDPVVITRHWDRPIRNQFDTFLSTVAQRVTVTEDAHGTVVRVPYRGVWRDRLLLEKKLPLVRRALSLLYHVGQYYTRRLDARYDLYREAERYMKAHRVDCIVASGEPFVLFRYAHRLSNKFGVPWVADYRDGWSTNHKIPKRDLLNQTIALLERATEKRMLDNAMFLISVSEPITQAIAALVDKPGFTIPNGAERWDGALHEPFPFFSVVYTGVLYDFPYIDILVNTVRRFLAEHPNDDIRFLFVGIAMYANAAVERVQQLQVEFPNHIFIYDRVPAEEALRYQMKATVLLSLIPGTQAKGIMGAKTYGYAATGRPILVIPSEPNPNTPFFPGRDIQRFAINADEAVNLLNMLYDGYRRGEDLRTSITEEEKFDISRASQLKKLAQLMDKFLDADGQNES